MGESRRQRRTRASAEGADAGDELGEVEGLGQVVVGAQAEALDAVGDAARRGQHQDAALAAPGHQAATDLVAVDTGDVAVQDHDVVGRGGGVGQGITAIEDDVDRHALAPQASGQRQGQLGVVFDQ